LVLVVLCLLIAVELRIRNNRAEAMRTIIEKELTDIRPKLTVVEQWIASTGDVTPREVLRRLDEIDAKLEGR
jgi:hypothetical protein